MHPVCRSTDRGGGAAKTLVYVCSMFEFLGPNIHDFELCWICFQILFLINIIIIPPRTWEFDPFACTVICIFIFISTLFFLRLNRSGARPILDRLVSSIPFGHLVGCVQITPKISKYFTKHTPAAVKDLCKRRLVYLWNREKCISLSLSLYIYI